MAITGLSWERLVEALPVSVVVFRVEGSRLGLAYANPAAKTRLCRELSPGRSPAELFPELGEQAVVALSSVARGAEARRLPGASVAKEVSDAGLTLFRIDESHLAMLFDCPRAESLTQRELDKLARFLESIVENIPAMIFVKDAETLRFELFNRAGEELLGISRKDLIGKTDADFFPPDQVSFFKEQDQTVLRMKELVDIPLEPIDTAHGRRWLHTKKIPILDASGEARHLLGISLDITARHRAEQALIQARNELEHRVLERTAELSHTVQQLEREARERRRAQEALKTSEERLRLSQKMEAVGRLAGGIAHDFNNMLSVILTQVEIALGRLEPSGPLKESLEAIRLAASRSTALTQQLLAFSRQQVVSPRLVDLNELVRNLEKMLRRVIGDDIVLVTRFYAVASQVRVDPGQIEQVVLNLVINARDAMPDGGNIWITTSEVELNDAYVRLHPEASPGKHVVLSVRDSGTGIDGETLKRIFEPFFTTKDPGRGTGLGLATAYGIVRQSGGSISVDSELGKGTEFRIHLPVAGNEQKPARLTPAQNPRAAPGHETILVVEDEELVRKVARTSLESLGYRVIVAADGFEALGICRSFTQSIDAVITDIIMPGLTGLALAQELRRFRPDLPVLYMSGYTDRTLIDASALGPLEAFVSKPFTPSLLGAKLRELLDRAL